MFDGIDITCVNDEYDRGYKAGKSLFCMDFSAPSSCWIMLISLKKRKPTVKDMVDFELVNAE